MKCVLAGLDLSSDPQLNVRLAVAVAKQKNASLVLLHALEPPLAEIPLIPIGAMAWEQTHGIAAETEMGRLANEVRQGGLEVEAQVRPGRAATVLLEAARDLGAELIVVGTHGRRGIAHLLLGSVAEEVVRLSSCPVLVTPPSLSSVTRWTSGQPLRLVVGSDGSAASEAALSWAGAHAARHKDDLAVVRVYSPAEETARFGLEEDGNRQDPTLLPLVARDLRRDVDATIGGFSARLRCRAAARNATEAFVEECVALEGDALVVGVSTARASDGLLRLKADAVLRASSVPVFCVPEASSQVPRRLPQVRSVLIAVDLSDVAEDVVRRGCGLLRPAGGRVALCYVHELGPNDAIAGIPIEPPVGDADRAELEAQLRRLIPAEVRAFGISTEVAVLEGRSAAAAILAAAERLDVDVIVVGSHSRGWLKRALLGSVAGEIAHRSNRPIFIVHGRPGPT